MERLQSRLFAPQGPIARLIDVSVLILAGLASFLSYYLIDFNVCAKYDCARVTVTRYFVDQSWLYLVLGVAIVGVGVFMARHRNTPRIYAAAIVVAVGGGFFLAGMVVFAILKEASSVS
ncbi:MAG: hypothetical protein AAFX44_10135 [Pseudomonadota bacterium]